MSPLTIGLYPFAADARISVDYNLRTSEWTLLIQDVRPSDEGLYHCQVSTKDASEHMYNVQLNVKSKRLLLLLVIIHCDAENLSPQLGFGISLPQHVT